MNEAAKPTSRDCWTGEKNLMRRKARMRCISKQQDNLKT